MLLSTERQRLSVVQRRTAPMSMRSGYGRAGAVASVCFLLTRLAVGVDPPICEVDCETTRFDLIWTDDVVGAGTLILLGEGRPAEAPPPYTGMLTDSVEETARLELARAAGDPASLRVHSSFVTTGGIGIQGWSLSIAVEGDLVPLDVTTEGTAAHSIPGGFEKTELVDPELPSVSTGEPQGHGAVSAIVITFDNFVLVPDSTETVLTLNVGTSDPLGLLPREARVFPKDGLQGSGQPVSNVGTLCGGTVSLCRGQDIALRFDPFLFTRGDANLDKKLDISDPVVMLRHQFFGDVLVLCDDAADANDDGVLDISDAVHMFGHLYLGKPPPPPPFPEPGGDFTPDALGCGEPVAASSS